MRRNTLIPLKMPIIWEPEHNLIGTRGKGWGGQCSEQSSGLLLTTAWAPTSNQERRTTAFCIPLALQLHCTVSPFLAGEMPAVWQPSFIPFQSAFFNSSCSISAELTDCIAASQALILANGGPATPSPSLQSVVRMGQGSSKLRANLFSLCWFSVSLSSPTLL